MSAQNMNQPQQKESTGQQQQQQRQVTISSLVSSTVFATQIAGTSLLNQDPPVGFFAASAEAASSAPTLAEVRRRGSSLSDEPRESKANVRKYADSDEFASRRQQKSYSKSNSLDKAGSNNGEHGQSVLFNTLTEEPSSIYNDDNERHSSFQGIQESATEPLQPNLLTTPEQQHGSQNGERKPTVTRGWSASSLHFLQIFMKWFCTPFGFLLTLYGLNIVAWGGMLFLLLCNAAPAMCSQDSLANNFDGCNDIDSPRRIWIEIDSQILNALFCVTGFGLLPWRARNLYYLLRFRTASRNKSIQERTYGLRVLAGFYKGWFRLPAHDTLDQVPTSEYLQGISSASQASTYAEMDDPRVPLRRSIVDRSIPTAADLIDEQSQSTSPLRIVPMPLAAPLTSIRATPTKLWKLDLFVYCQIANTAFQSCLCGFMWGMNRFNRPSWSTGLFVALACGIAGVGGIVSWWEGRRVKEIEGDNPRSNADEEKAMGSERGFGLKHSKPSHESIVVAVKEDETAT